MNNIITIKFWSIDLRLAEKLFDKLNDIINKNINPFLIKIRSSEIIYDTKEIKQKEYCIFFPYCKLSKAMKESICMTKYIFCDIYQNLVKQFYITNKI